MDQVLALLFADRACWTNLGAETAIDAGFLIYDKLVAGPFAGEMKNRTIGAKIAVPKLFGENKGQQKSK